MEQDSKDPQFDSYLGGDNPVPGFLNLSDFIKHRMEEVVMLTEAIDESPFRGQAFQRLPKHMRRRQMSHYIKRLPRRLQRPYLMSLKDGPPVPTKRPSRKYRRRPGNLLLEYNRRQKTSVWLETHIWHAKRFHMTTKWGYKLPKKPVNKSCRACYRAISEHCLLVDMSYYNCVELQGPESELLDGLKRCTSTSCGLTFGARMYLSGAREGSVTLFNPDSYPYKVIGSVTFMWQPGRDPQRKLWVWVHPKMHEEVVECFQLLFDLSRVPVDPIEEDIIVEKELLKPNARVKKRQKKEKIEQIKLEPKNVPFDRTPKFTNKSETVIMTLLKDTLNRFRLAGPLSQALVSQTFTVASVQNDSEEVEIVEVERKKRKLDKEEVEEIPVEKPERERTWWEEYYGKEDNLKHWSVQKNCGLSEHSRPSDMPSGMILGLVIEDPRMRIPSKREKAVVKTEEVRQMPETGIHSSFSQSPIWIPQIRDEVSLRKLTSHQINEARAKKIVPGFHVGNVIPDHLHSRIPILLVQTPGNGNPQNGKLGFGSGWDIIAPAGFGMPIWLSLIFRGARAGGLKETDLLRFECNNLREYLPPDSAAGESENREKLQKLRAHYFKLPPNKRANFVKLGVVSPFYPPWKALVRDWTQTGKTDSEKVQFRVLRDVSALAELRDVLQKLPKGQLDCPRILKWGSDCLIPISVECSGKGRPREMALICLPEDEDFQKGRGPVEPSHADDNETRRKMLKAEHSKRLKSLKRKRRKDRSKMKEDFAKNLPTGLKWRDIQKSDSAPSEHFSGEYKAEMERLWLPDAETPGNFAETSARKVLGFVVRGEFSYSRSRGLGLGFVSLPGLVELCRECERKKSKVVALVRNRNQVQYRLARLRIEC